ncbi:conserved hypothetical protein [Talaromyces stipitatus ATCC 10500]|uniref:Uncharacterized protein n=1 Tax=Talaromyces stipitatus (strain ATCC 10500 / CBS 375.48 / QM 6759 / NRRL 1006) TaxID=441959 RepID=B8M4F9_TALSN|nr:uncharacterized protein TSTA_024760 [Talaromyces stipitatus ATCC 10500]EED19154.1 conserved hypothetical protein [Talaromyces stipitatus ATCC 10500]
MWLIGPKGDNPAWEYQIMPRRRHYSWPFSGSETSAEVEELRFSPRKIVSPLFTSRTQRPTGPFTFDRPFGLALSLYTSSDEEELLSSAGIIDSKVEKRHVKRQRRERRARSKRQRRGRKQKSFSGYNVADASDDDAPEEMIISSITQASEAPTAILRRFFWIHWGKARQLFITLHNIQYLTDSWTSYSKPTGPAEKGHEMNARYVAKLNSPSAPSLSNTKASADEGVMSQSMVDNNEWMLRPGRRHRRCHSEQPRAWREPNPGLWTLAEE